MNEKEIKFVEVLAHYGIDVLDKKGNIHTICSCQITADNVNKEGYYIPKKSKAKKC
ncbi:MAG: hypothetical protein PHF86_02720 [Candidatus Nanoarchaeia archaeon]|jgi:hypothetical protein|nr:hypothetical protein [Candidatus Nanoarchaeia archaeon]